MNDYDYNDDVMYRIYEDPSLSNWNPHNARDSQERGKRQYCCELLSLKDINVSSSFPNISFGLPFVSFSNVEEEEDEEDVHGNVISTIP